jgi:hypothetical protein
LYSDDGALDARQQNGGEDQGERDPEGRVKPFRWVVKLLEQEHGWNDEVAHEKDREVGRSVVGTKLA